MELRIKSRGISLDSQKEKESNSGCGEVQKLRFFPKYHGSQKNSFKLRRCRKCEIRELNQKGPPEDTGKKQVLPRRQNLCRGFGCILALGEYQQ